MLAQDATIPLDHFYVKREKRMIRKFLTKFRVGIGTGLGTTFFRHQLSGFGVYQPITGTPSIFRTIAQPPVSSLAYSNWITNSVPQIISPDPAGFFVHSDTATIKFKGGSWNVPLQGTLHFEWKRYRVGAGYSYEYINLGKFKSVTFQDKISEFNLDKSGALIRKYFGMFGASFYRYQDYLFTGDIQVGDYQPKSSFNKALISPSLYVNIGVTIERDFSEYLRAFIRPNFEFKKYDLAVGGGLFQHNMNAFYVNFGFSYRLPELPKCFHERCQAQVNHAHGNKEYRSRMHPIYKKQNPGYGENHKKLVKYRGKNKRKLNPY